MRENLGVEVPSAFCSHKAGMKAYVNPRPCNYEGNHPAQVLAQGHKGLLVLDTSRRTSTLTTLMVPKCEPQAPKLKHRKLNPELKTRIQRAQYILKESTLDP